METKLNIDLVLPSMANNSLHHNLKLAARVEMGESATSWPLSTENNLDVAE